MSGLTDVAKFNAIFDSDHNQYHDVESFAQMSQISKSTVYDWRSGKSTNIQSHNRRKLNEIWSLDPSLWLDTFYDSNDLLRKLPRYIKAPSAFAQLDAFERLKGEPQTVLSQEEEDELLGLAKSHPVSLPGQLDKKSSDFLFELAKLLKDRNQAMEAFTPLSIIEKRKDAFYYHFYPQISHLKAILCSHEKIGKWDEAIDELYFLYKVVGYHRNEPEILTLLASNLKRKAIFADSAKPLPKESVDKEMLEKALDLYKEAYAQSESWYDKLNEYYLTRILESIEKDDVEEDLEYVSISRPKDQDLTMEQKKNSDRNWWETVGELEFMMLTRKEDSRGRIDPAKFYWLAESSLEMYLEKNEISPFELSTTQRQLEIYRHYVDDEFAKKLLEILESLPVARGGCPDQT